MNIFVLDADPNVAAISQCDKHVVKMPLETAQLLCTAAFLNGASGVRYKPTHAKHPCTLWTAASRANFDWLVIHGLALANEYRRRYGKTHASEAVILDTAKCASLMPACGSTPFAQAMPDEYRCDDSVVAYRRYYLGAKAAIATWRQPAAPPAWWKSIVC